MQARILEHDKIRTTTDLPEVRAALLAGHRIWVDLERQTAETDELLVDVFRLHPLTIEDIWSERSAPKLDDFDEYLYVIVHGIGAARHDKLDTVELDVVIGPNWLITHDPAGLIADDIGTELDHSARVMVRGISWLAHAVLDRAVDRYMPVIDELDTEIEQLAIDVLEYAGKPRGRDVMKRILELKRRLLELRRMSMHQREILLRLSRGEMGEIPDEALPFYRDVYDHFLRVNDVVEGYRDLVNASLDAYLSVQSNRMSEVMKTLTLMSTMMMPLTFIVGLYGMNFKHMPELDWVWGYPAVLGVMVLVVAGILLWFRHRGWLGGDHS